MAPSGAAAGTPSAARDALIAAELKPAPLFPARLPRRLLETDAKLELTEPFFAVRSDRGSGRGFHRGAIELSRRSHGELRKYLRFIRSTGGSKRRERIGRRRVLRLCAHACFYAWHEQGFTYSVSGRYLPGPDKPLSAEGHKRAIIRQLRPLSGTRP
jgi:hypothetical protein